MLLGVRGQVRDVLAIFKRFDADGNGTIDESELAALCEAIGMTATVADADTFVNDGVIDPLEFFAFYVKCTREEAERAFAEHKDIFASVAPPSKSIKEWTADEVRGYYYMRVRVRLPSPACATFFTCRV